MKKIFHIENKIYPSKLKLIGDNNNLSSQEIIVEFDTEIIAKMNLKDSIKNLLNFIPKNAIYFYNKGKIFHKGNKQCNRKFIS